MAKAKIKMQKLPSTNVSNDPWQAREDMHHLAQAEAIKKDRGRLNAVKTHVKSLVQATGMNGKKKK